MDNKSMAATYSLVHIYPLGDKQSLPTGLKKLEIDNRPIKIFREVLLDQIRMWQNTQGWWLEFFVDSAHVQRFFVRLTEVQDPDGKPESDMEAGSWRDKPITTLAYAQLDAEYGQHSDEDLEDACAKTSEMVRGSRAIAPRDLYEASTHFGYVNGRGIQYISKIKNRRQFERHVLLYALAYAYLLIMERLGDSLSKSLRGSPRAGDLRQLYKDIALFNAKEFFHQPVRLSNAPTCEAWLRIDKALGIRESNDELFKQVENAHYIFDLDEEKHDRQFAAIQNRREKRRDLALTIVGLLLALASAPGAIETVKGWF